MKWNPRFLLWRQTGVQDGDLSDLLVVVMECFTAEELFGKDGFKQFSDEVYRRYGFISAKVEMEEHHVKMYTGKKTEEIVKAAHPKYLLRGNPNGQ